MSDLDAIARKYGTDKSTAHHGYTLIYPQYLPDRDSSVNLLELGYGGHEDAAAGGESAEMWLEWFPAGQITVIDNEAKVNIPKGLHFYQVSQDDRIGLEWVNKIQGDWDVIVDDASHISSLTVQSFLILWPMLKPGGLYFVEDTHSSYHSWYYGEASADPDPDMDNNTFMGFAKRLADQVNEDLLDEQYRMGYGIEYVHFYKDLVIIKKGL
jgi:hypothetical protein